MTQGRSLNIWHNKNFVVLLLTGLLLSFGNRVYELALPLIIYDLTHSSVAMGTMRAIEFLPNLLLAMVIGVYVDRANKKHWMLTAVLSQTLLLFALYAYTHFFVADPRVFYVAGFFLMLCNYAFQNAKISSTKLALPSELLTSANAKFTFVQTLVGVMGPAISGAILFLSSLYYGLLLTATMFLVAMLMLSFLDLKEAPKSKEGRDFLKELKTAWQVLRQNRPLWLITCFVVFFNATAGAFDVMLIFFVRDELQWSTALIGGVMSCGGFGGLFGAVVVERLRKVYGLGKTLAFCVIALGCCYGVTGFLSSPFTIGLTQFAFGFVATIQNILIWSYRHETTPAQVIGRVSGITGSIFKLGMPFAIFGAGFLADVSGARIVFFACALVQFVVFVVFVFSAVLREK